MPHSLESDNRYRRRFEKSVEEC